MWTQQYFEDTNCTGRVDKISVVCHSFYMGTKVPPVEIHCELVTVYGDNVMTVNHVHKWCREFESGRVNVKDQ
jgi:hypothetical protein